MLEELKQKEKELAEQLSAIKVQIEKQQLVELKSKLTSLVGKYFKKEYGDSYNGEGEYYKILECFPKQGSFKVDMLTLNKYAEFVYYKQSLIDYRKIDACEEISKEQYDKQVKLFIDYE